MTVEATSGSVAVLYQVVSPPAFDGARKPMKDGGYADSSADIACALRRAGVRVVTPSADPDPARVLDWTFPDSADGIACALAHGADVLWANTVLFGAHPIQAVLDRFRIVGQDPDAVERFDDKFRTNDLLRAHGLPVAHSVLVCAHTSADTLAVDDITDARLRELGFQCPLVLKPVRGRGSQGVVRTDTVTETIAEATRLLRATVEVDGQTLRTYGDRLILESYLPGTEITYTVLPPGEYRIGGVTRTKPAHWTLPPVKRFNHQRGIAPYSGAVAVVRNSAALAETDPDWPAAAALAEACATAGTLVGAGSPIRIDARASADGAFALFDLNMKPNLTGAGRPGRDDQDSLTALAARAIGWDYPDLLTNLLAQAWSRKTTS